MNDEFLEKLVLGALSGIIFVVFGSFLLKLFKSKSSEENILSNLDLDNPKTKVKPKEIRTNVSKKDIGIEIEKLQSVIVIMCKKKELLNNSRDSNILSASEYQTKLTKLNRELQMIEKEKVIQMGILKQLDRELEIEKNILIYIQPKLDKLTELLEQKLISENEFYEKKNEFYNLEMEKHANSQSIQDISDNQKAKMEKYNIVFEKGIFIYSIFRYNNLEDAINYAESLEIERNNNIK